jgi:predicted nucleic acid-binding protein
VGVVVDSSIFIAAERWRFDWVGFHARLGVEPLYLSVVTFAELLHGAERADTSERREKRRRFIADVEARYPLLAFGRDEATEYAKVWAELAATGNFIGAHDQMIAATARHHGYSVATLNRRDFERVARLTVIDAESFRIAPQ